ncbi:MAG: bifunctional 2-C-methyl-D-erythritol 4-phosphate cytidylyltransferase/2-C-methyl-D-erythritol 2,4-cyclodiphosphate synthase [Pseudomonadota bacterium]
MTHPTTGVLIVAAGKGLRAASGGIEMPKQYQMIGDATVLERSIRCFVDREDVRSVTVVIHPDHDALYRALDIQHPKLTSPVTGGDERSDSVRLGLEALSGEPPELVLIHDAARPFVSQSVIDQVISAAQATGAAIPCLPVVDTLKAVNGDGTLSSTVDRSKLRAAQTPQGFKFEAILDAHQKAVHSGLAFTDDAAVAEWQGVAVAEVVGEKGNLKLTTAEDLKAAQPPSPPPIVRVGQGYDVHAFADDRPLFLGGVEIPHTRGLAGHSDADVLLHAITDALLGTLANGDIGSHFPPSDAAWKDAVSDQFLVHACALSAEDGGVIQHVDATIICEAPKIGPHRDTIREKIADIMDLNLRSVSVKATTSERLGFTGRREGIAAMATVTVEYPRA